MNFEIMNVVKCGVVIGRNLSMLPVEPKLGKMLILGSIFNCLDPIMTVVASLSVRDPFLMPFDKKDVRRKSSYLCLIIIALNLKLSGFSLCRYSKLFFTCAWSWKFFVQVLCYMCVCHASIKYST